MAILKVQAAADNVHKGSIVIARSQGGHSRGHFLERTVAGVLDRVSSPSAVFPELVAMYRRQFLDGTGDVPEPGANFFKGGFNIYNVAQLHEVVGVSTDVRALGGVKLEALALGARIESPVVHFGITQCLVYKPDDARLDKAKNLLSASIEDFMTRVCLNLNAPLHEKSFTPDDLSDEHGIYIVNQLLGPLAADAESDFVVAFAQGAEEWILRRPTLAERQRKLLVALSTVRNEHFKKLMADTELATYSPQTQGLLGRDSKSAGQKLGPR